jgi:hypothetical protein
MTKESRQVGENREPFVLLALAGLLLLPVLWLAALALISAAFLFNFLSWVLESTGQLSQRSLRSGWAANSKRHGAQMLTKIKFAVMGGLAFLATLFFGLWKHAQAGRERDKRKAEEKKREVEKLGVEAMIGGLERENETTKKPVDTSRRNHFE